MLHPKFQLLAKRIQQKFHSIGIPPWLIPVLIGIIATIWFLIRVIPKPQRASYPCMKAAYPFMSFLVVWLLSITGIYASSKLVFVNLIKRKYRFALLSFFTIIAFSAVYVIHSSNSIFATQKQDIVHTANVPIGTAQGILPGSVVWEWDPAATNEKCTNDLLANDGYFLNKNTNQTAVDEMFRKTILRIADKTNELDAWNAIFTYFNKQKGKAAESYKPGEKIFIKINQGCANWSTTTDMSRQSWALGYAETSPQIILAVLKQLVNTLGVAQSDIIVADPIAHIYKDSYDILHAEFPNVIYGDRNAANSTYGRTTLHKETVPVIHYSDKGTVLDETSDCIYTEMQTADYMINIAALKAHARAGITLTAKNHFGSQTRDGATHLHNGLVAAENDAPERNDYGMYRVQVDLMGSKYLGRNTLLFIVDGLWGGTEAVETPVKWTMAPFNNDWPSSLFVSQDQVALESVCFDFLRNEASVGSAAWKNRPNMAQGVDDYLHQAASPSNWPAGLTYDPDNSGTPLPSLGVHEHWNNPTDKQYSRNLGQASGINLITEWPKSLNSSKFVAYDTDTQVPIFDGDGNDSLWTSVPWQYIDQVWIPYGEKLANSDFNGRFKILWSAKENKLFVLAETEDDDFVDGYVYPNSDYPDRDILEIFIDENKSGGTHIFDNAATGENAENAFSYHIAINQPADGGTTSDKVVCDIAGKDWNNYNIKNYASHFPDFMVKRNGHKLTWEFSLIVVNDKYDPTKTLQENTAARVILAKDKTLGFAMAYCDADGGVGRDNFIGSDWGAKDANNQFNAYWQNADGYGTLTLKSASSLSTAINQPIAKTTSSCLLFPNPASSYIVISKLSINPKLSVTVELINNSGVTVYQQHYKTSNTVFEQKIALPEFPNGIYFAKITNGKQIVTRKFQIIHK